MADQEPRKRYNVGVVKIPQARRNVARSVLRTARDVRERDYLDVLGSDTPDNDARFPIGSNVAYKLELTEEEAEQFAAASNVRYVEEDRLFPPCRAVGRPTGTYPAPFLSTLAYTRSRYVDLRRWHGRDVPVAVLDQGTTQAVRDAMGYTLVARTVIETSVHLGPGQELVQPGFTHGCGVAPCAVPAGGLLLDGVIIEPNSGGSFESGQAAGIVWATDNGAKVINVSFGGAPDNGAAGQVLIDAASHARTAGAHIVYSAGNDNTGKLTSSAGLSRTYANVHSSIAFDESTDRRAAFSNYASDASGCSAGVNVAGMDAFGRLRYFDGTSASAPVMVQLLARGATGSTFTMNQVGAAFKANTRSTGAPSAEQGGGAYDLHRALAALGAVPATPTTAGNSTVEIVDTRGVAAFSPSFVLTAPASAVPDDMQICVIVSSFEADGFVASPGWVLIADRGYDGKWESQDVGSTRVRVLAKSVANGDPSATPMSFNAGDHDFVAAAITVRGAGGLDPERFVPIPRFGTSGQISSVSVQPATSNDLLIVAFAQRHPDAPSATLSVPTGLTSRSLIRPAAGRSLGYPLLLTTRQLTDGARTPVYTSTSNSTTGTWCSVAFTVPTGASAIAPVVQTEPAGPPGAFLPFYVGS